MSEAKSRDRSSNVPGLFCLAAVCFLILGAGVGFFARLTFENEFLVSAYVGGAAPGFRARISYAVGHWPDTFRWLLFGGIAGVLLSPVYAVIKLLRRRVEHRLPPLQQHATLTSPPNAESTQITTRPRTPDGGRDVTFTYSISQLILCLVTAVVVGSTAYICAWLSLGNYWLFTGKQGTTRTELSLLSDAIEKYRQKNGHLPAELTDLDRETTSVLLPDQRGWPCDFWSRPFHYDVNGDSYDLYSLGRDGQPGGDGLDADLHADRIDLWTEKLTLRQFTEETRTGGIRATCFLAGAIALPLCLLGIKKSTLERASRAKTFFRYVVTVLFTLVMAVVISVLHLPTGH
jgi:general secretion pathway protein G